MLMPYIALLIIVLAGIYIVYLLSQSKEEYLHLHESELISQNHAIQANQIESLEQELIELNPILTSLIGQRIISRFFIPSLIILIFSLLFGMILTNPQLGFFLGLIIGAAYVGRIFYHRSAEFRSKLLNQLERILLSIRNNLSTGMTLDYAVANTLKFNQEEPLGPNLSKFIKISETNFINNFPLWLKTLEQNYKLKNLSRASQLLKFELNYTSNQEEAFINAASKITEKINLNRKQQNIIMMTFFTMDFMAIAFLGILFLIIPNISYDSNLNWWQSSSRAFIVFISGLIIWSSYLLTVALTLWRQS